MRLASRAAESATEPDINRFVLEHGRLPFLNDPVPPWHYRGWLLFQVQMADNHPDATGRWNHYMRTLEAGCLLDEPIPQVRFAYCPAAAGVKMLEKCVDLLAYREPHWSAFEAFVQWLAWGLAVSRNKPAMEEASSEALYRVFNFEPLLLHPHDYLGHLLSERRGKGWNPHAYYPTPHAVSLYLLRQLFRSQARTSEVFRQTRQSLGKHDLLALGHSTRRGIKNLDRVLRLVCSPYEEIPLLARRSSHRCLFKYRERCVPEVHF